MQTMGLFSTLGILAFLMPILQILFYTVAIVAAFKAIQALNLYIRKNS
jgi:hypothetical protein